MISMNWTPTHFPAAMRSLSPSTREKAIELANSMMAYGNMSRHEAIQASIQEARRLARDSRQDSTGTTVYAFPQA